ncbi:MAG: sensory box/GGDEF family protein [Dehalococcoidia bacterium]|nr:sensory box/GGDEF family protein [Dehalococcoidia bacterium]MBF8304150.1 sensory box/GGDEF family protein [Dehalococcoidia bacterium]
MPGKRNLQVVLVVEDEIDVRKFASKVLEMEGYTVLQSGKAEDGLDLLKQHTVNLVLVDLRLPVNSGLWLLGEIKRTKETSSIPVVVLTASAEASQREKALGMGATDYLVKPISAAGIRKAVARVLRLKK